MKKLATTILATMISVTVGVSASAQETKHIMLSPKSNINTSSVAEGFAKYCTNVVITEDAAKADYTLEAASNTTYSGGQSAEHWHFTLINKEGDVVFTTHPKLAWGRKHHFEEICKFINGGKKQ